MSLKAIRNSFHAKYKNTIAIQRMLRSDNFELAYTNANMETRKKFKDAVEREDRITLKTLIRQEVLKLTPFHRMNMGKLRSIGKNIGVQNYQKLNKIPLIREIENVVERLKKSSE